MARSISRERRPRPGRGLLTLAFVGLAEAARAASADLAMDTARIASPSAPTAQKVHFEARVVNLGTAASPASKVRLYRSTDPKITSADTRLLVQSLDGISAGRYRMVDADLSVGTSVGKFWFGACVDAVSGDTNSANNCSAGLPVQVGARPDVAVHSVTVGPGPVAPRALVDLRAMVESVGSGAAGGGWLDFRAKIENSESADWDHLGSAPTPSLPTGASVQVAARDTAPRYSGQYSIHACLSSVPFDGSESNDCADGGPLIVEGPDVEVSETAVDDLFPEPGATFTLSATVRSRGTESAPARDLHFVAADEPDWFPYGDDMATDTMPELAPGESVRVSREVSFLGPATRYVSVCADSLDSENGDNNCSPAVKVVSPGIVLDPDFDPLRVGATALFYGRGFTAGTRMVFYVATPNGAVTHGPFAPTAWEDDELEVDVPATIALGNGFVAIEAINTDDGETRSPLQCRNLLGSDDRGPPSLEFVGLRALEPPNCGVPLASTRATVAAGSPVGLFGRGFANPRANLFTLSASFGPLEPEPGWTSESATFVVPAEVPAGPVTIQLVNEPYTGNVQSNAVVATVGPAIGIEGVAQAGSTITVTGTGFTASTVINFFNRIDSTVVNLGGLTQGGAARIPLSNVTSTGFTFQRPAGAVAGKANVQALNPPFVPVTSTGNDPQGAFDLQ